MFLDPEGLTPHDIRVHLEHVGVQQVGHEIILRSRKHWNYTSWCFSTVGSAGATPDDDEVAPLGTKNPVTVVCPGSPVSTFKTTATRAGDVVITGAGDCDSGAFGRY